VPVGTDRGTAFLRRVRLKGSVTSSAPVALWTAPESRCFDVAVMKMVVPTGKPCWPFPGLQLVSQRWSIASRPTVTCRCVCRYRAAKRGGVWSVLFWWVFIRSLD